MPFLPIRPAGRFVPASLFGPRSVAVVGAASQEGAQVLANLRGGSFAGEIHALEQPAEIAALAKPADLAVIATQADGVAPTLAALAAKGIFAAVVIGRATDTLADAARQ